MNRVEWQTAMTADEVVSASMAEFRWLVTGASGQLGGYVVRRLAETRAGAILSLAGRHEVGTAGVDVRRVDLADWSELQACVRAFEPTHVLHLGAMTAVSDCHARPADAERINVGATRTLAAAAAECGARVVFSSTDMVFDGESAPYAEADPPHPLSEYGRSKVAAERLVAGLQNALVARLPLMYGLPRTNRATTFAAQLAALRAGQPLRLFTDEFRTPIWLADAARAVVGLARSDLVGVIHVAGPERLSRYELVARCAVLLGIKQPNLVATSRLAVAAPEPRPADLSLGGARFAACLPHLTPGPVRAEALVV